MKSDSCPTIEDLSQYLLGLGSPTVYDFVETHLETCKPCLNALETATVQDELTDAVSNPILPEISQDRLSLILSFAEKQIQLEQKTSGIESKEVRLAAGAHIGGYVIEDMIGRGGMGTVYAAYDPRLKRRVAIKVIRASKLTSEYKQRIHQ